jgi:glycosyltransferase involved in cell wall biosynthesis
MYLMVSHIPIYVDGSRYYTHINWQRDLVLARDWLARPFGTLKLLAPSLSLAAVDREDMQLSSIGHYDDIRVVPSFDSSCRTREFWLRQRHQWLDAVRQEVQGAEVIHVSACDVYRPLAFMAHEVGIRSGVVTVLVGPDMDPHVTMPANVKGRLYCMMFDRLMCRAIRDSDLALLKEGLVYDRYAKYGKNVKEFCHSMHSKQDILDEDLLEKRLKTLCRDRSLRAVYAGRFVLRKGLRDSIAAIARARQLGVDVEYHLYGDGPEKGSLQHLAVKLGVEDLVHFQGFVEYSSQFIAKLAAYDLLLFMPTEEDTPRMLYDAMAVGLPLLGSRIPFLEHRVKNDRMGIVVDVGDYLAAADHLHQFHEDPTQLMLMSRAALVAGKQHASEEWYKRRTEWTQEAVERHKHRRGM